MYRLTTDRLFAFGEQAIIHANTNGSRLYENDKAHS